jgi:hypothetical protein
MELKIWYAVFKTPECILKPSAEFASETQEVKRCHNRGRSLIIYLVGHEIHCCFVTPNFIADFTKAHTLTRHAVLQRSTRLCPSVLVAVTAKHSQFDRKVTIPDTCYICQKMNYTEIKKQSYMKCCKCPPLQRRTHPPLPSCLMQPGEYFLQSRLRCTALHILLFSLLTRCNSLGATTLFHYRKLFYNVYAPQMKCENHLR